MAMKKRFYSVDGQMVGYEEGGVRKDFLTDHLGSVIAIMDENEVRVFDTRYSAYGRNRWITGTGCGFGWVGSYGYRETSLFHMSHYVRARHYSYVTGGWSTVDPLWPDESAYGYVGGRSTWSVDPSGKNPPVGQGGFPRKGCDANTREYQDRCNKTGNMLDCCAAKVSAAICLAIKAGKLGKPIEPFVDPIVPPLPIVPGINLRDACKWIIDLADDTADKTQCQNDCMIDIWRKRDTPRWRDAIATCKKYGESSKRCCEASVLAEQDGYNRCAPKCFPPLGIVPYDWRVGFARGILKCCG